MTLLHDELIAAYRHARRPIYHAAVTALGLPLGEGYWWGLAHVAADSEFYEPDPDGRLALIVGAFQYRQLFDLVAVQPTGFGIRTRRGEVQLLGFDALEDSRWEPQPLVLYADAFSWLRHGRRGATIVNWDRIAFELADMPSIVCETEALAAEIETAFARPLRQPPLFVRPSPAPTSEIRHASLS